MLVRRTNVKCVLCKLYPKNVISTLQIVRKNAKFTKNAQKNNFT